MPILFYRADDEEADDDDTLPRPALPVPDGPAVVDESIPPADGLDYLKRDRAQAGTMPDTCFGSNSSATGCSVGARRKWRPQKRTRPW